MDSFVVLAYYVAFGPHGPRAPVNPPGTTVKILTGVSALIASAGLLYAGFRSIGMLSFLLVSMYSHTIYLFFFLKKIRYSTTATQNDQQGVGRSHQRACKRAQDQPHLRFVNFPFTFFSRYLTVCCRYHLGGLLWQRLRYAQVDFSRLAVEPRCFAAVGGRALSCVFRVLSSSTVHCCVHFCIENKSISYPRSPGDRREQQRGTSAIQVETYFPHCTVKASMGSTRGGVQQNAYLCALSVRLFVWLLLCISFHRLFLFLSLVLATPILFQLGTPDGCLIIDQSMQRDNRP